MNTFDRFYGPVLLFSVVLCVPGFDAHAAILTSSGSISGTVNGFPVSASLEGGVGDTTTGFVSGKVSGLDDFEAGAWIEINSLLSIKCRTVAAAYDGAVNLYDLTRGNFFIQSQVSFDTGQVLSLDSTVAADPLNPNNLKLRTLVSGTAPIFDPRATVVISDYSETWTQSTLTTIKMDSLRNFSINGIRHDYRWKSVVSYDGASSLPFDEIRNAWNVSVKYDYLQHELQISQFNSVRPVPEPSALTIWFLGTSLYGWVRLQRRKIAVV